MGVTSGLWHPDQYRGKKVVTVQVGQLVSGGVIPRSQEKQVEKDWIEFFSSGESRIRDLTIWSRVKQEIIDSLVGQTQLQKLVIKWGPYSDLTPLSSLTKLESLELRGATRVENVQPLAALTCLRSLTLDEASKATDLAPIGELTRLTILNLGNGHPGSDKTVALRDLYWLRSLANLRELGLPGTSLSLADVEIIAELPQLRKLKLPLRRSYRKRVFELAATNVAFAGAARSYTDYEKWLAKMRRSN